MRIFVNLMVVTTLKQKKAYIIDGDTLFIVENSNAHLYDRSCYSDNQMNIEVACYNSRKINIEHIYTEYRSRFWCCSSLRRYKITPKTLQQQHQQ